MKRRSFLAAIIAAATAVPLLRTCRPAARPVYVFEVWDEEYIAAHSETEAADYARTLVAGYSDVPSRLTDETMRRESFWEIDGRLTKLTFEDALARDLSDGVKTPYYFASAYA